MGTTSIDYLREKSLQKVNRVSLDIKRYLFLKITLNNRFIILKGARGVGKTTLLLQHIKQKHGLSSEALYISLDDLWFSEHNLVDLADLFVKEGGKYLYIDEIHKYPNWSQALKNIYDDHHGLSIIATSSSSLNILQGTADVSRRALIYELKELSLREFLLFRTGKDYPVYSIDDLLKHHTHIAGSLLEDSSLKPIALLKEYNSFGAYPFFKEDIEGYHQRLEQVISTIIESDLPAVLNIDYSSVQKLKKLLFIISESVPFKPNVSKLSEKTGVARDTFLRYLHYLNDAHLIQLLHSSKKGSTLYTKPEKIYLRNTNLLHALNPRQISSGTTRETFFQQQVGVAADIHYPPKGDFLVNDTLTFEVGGKQKSRKQIKDVPDSYVVSDNREISSGTTIPLWLFGFLY